MNIILAFFISFLSLGDQHAEKTKSPVKEEFTTYYFIRHAEKELASKEDKDPALSKEGMARAAKWAQIFQDVEFDLIFSSDTKRTRMTATAVGETQEKEVEIYNPKALNDLNFREKTKGKTVLVVGHSNTNPAFVNLVLGTEKYKALDESQYGILFIVSVGPGGEKSCQVLHIN